MSRIKGKLNQIKARLLTPNFPPLSSVKVEIECLGSEYGRKYVALSELVRNPVLVSGGVGEDISFDVEFIKKYKAIAFLIDPTPRAIEHMNQVNARFGYPSESTYSATGRQLPSSYDLRVIDDKNLFFYQFALLNVPGKVKFYEPPIVDHVSYSIQNIQNSFRSKGSFIEVEAIGPVQVSELVRKVRINVLKLDIEGSEYLFIKSCFENQIFPDQVLIEIDELHFPSIRSKKISKKLFNLFERHKYELVYRDGFNFTYLRSSLIKFEG